MMGFMIADAWKRAEELQGRNILFIAGCDAHGTPIMLRARDGGVTPERNR